MGVYDSRNPYPKDFDMIDTSECDLCTFPCDIHEYCIHEIKNN